MPQGKHVLPTHSKGSSDLQGHLGVRVIWVLGFWSQPCHLQGRAAVLSLLTFSCLRIEMREVKSRAQCPVVLIEEAQKEARDMVGFVSGVCLPVSQT